MVFPVDEVRRRAPPSSAKGRSAEGGGVEAVEIKEYTKYTDTRAINDTDRNNALVSYFFRTPARALLAESLL